MNAPERRILERLIERARRLPHFRRKYAALPPIIAPETFGSIPLMDKQDLAAVLPELRVAEQLQGYLFGSGGTMGSPKLSLIPSHMFVGDILKHWSPLTTDDILCNMFAPGKLWSAHYFYNQVGTKTVRETIALGAIDRGEMLGWLDFLEDQHVTAIAATPSTLKLLCRTSLEHGRSLGFIRKLLWVGESFDSELQNLAAQALPYVELWGLYGSTETWVIGYNGPNCSVDTFHSLPYQHVEVDQNHGIVVTTTHPDCMNLLIRYKTDDMASHAQCRCGRPGLQVHGRMGSSIKFRGALVTPEDLIQLARNLPDAGVREAQVAVIRSPNQLERMEVRVILTQKEAVVCDRIRARLLEYSIDLKNLFDGDPSGLQIVPVDALQVNERTHKQPALVWEDEE